MPVFDPNLGDGDALGQSPEAMLERIGLEPVFGQNSLDQSGKATFLQIERSRDGQIVNVARVDQASITAQASDPRVNAAHHLVGQHRAGD